MIASTSFQDPIVLLRSVMTKRELRLKFMQVQTSLQEAEQAFGPESHVVSDLTKTAEMLWECTDGGPLKREHIGG